MPRFLLFCLVSSQFAATAVMAARPFAVLATSSVADAPSAPAVLHAHSLLESRFARSPLSSHHGGHRPFDRTFAGGKIIVAGFAAAIVIAIFCYIRITRRKNLEPKV
ncbi:hypothetical protein BS78_02G307700 [Paspalum vaginatum]|nr:hypothetical protein BS78_02G307700 [Paspalum vaginatum]